MIQAELFVAVASVWNWLLYCVYTYCTFLSTFIHALVFPQKHSLHTHSDDSPILTRAFHKHSILPLVDSNYTHNSITLYNM